MRARGLDSSLFLPLSDVPLSDLDFPAVAADARLLAARFEADFIGTPMSGHASTGYDPVRQIFVGTWKDSSNPFLYTFEGFLDAEKKTLKMSGENFDPVRRVSSMYRSVIEYLSPKEKILTLSVEDEDGGVRNILEYHYKRL